MDLRPDCDPFQRPFPPRRVGAIFTLTLCCIPGCQCLLKGSFTWIGCLIFMPGDLIFKAATQKISLDHPALVARSLVFLGPRKLWKSEWQFLADYYPLGTAETVDWGPPSPSSVKEVLCLSWREIHLEERFQVGHTFSANSAVLKEQGCECHLGIPLCLPPHHLEKQFICWLGALICMTATHRTPVDLLALVASRNYACSVAGLYIFA